MPKLQLQQIKRKRGRPAKNGAKYINGHSYLSKDGLGFELPVKAVKRDGRIVDFDAIKIEIALEVFKDLNKQPQTSYKI